MIKAKYGQDACNVGDEGGFAPGIQSTTEGLDLLVEAVAKAGHTKKVSISMDVASSEFYKNGKYDLDFKNPNNDGSQRLSSGQLGDFYLVRQAELMYSFVFLPARKVIIIPIIFHPLRSSHRSIQLCPLRTHLIKMTGMGGYHTLTVCVAKFRS